MREYCHITITDDKVITKTRAKTNDDLETDVQFYHDDEELDLIIRSMRRGYWQTVLSDKRRGNVS
tara:strand:- start:249 stop:443 length:195 start_codon:yes stop_codon:yes gene_type:complete